MAARINPALSQSAVSGSNAISQTAIEYYPGRKFGHIYDDSTNNMTAPSDIKEFSRSRLCQLAKVERGKHRRWLTLGLLKNKRRYVIGDALRAALLDEINEAFKPQAARSVWLAIRDEIGIPGNRLELIVTLSTLKARLIRSDSELLASLPRGEEVVILDLGLRARAVDARVRDHLTAISKGLVPPDRRLADGDFAAI